MRISVSILSFVLTAPLLVSCGEQGPAIDVDPKVGRDCFDTHIAALPNGTQYEGIERAVPGRVTIRVMTGVELTTLDCGLNPDGSLQRGGEWTFGRITICRGQTMATTFRDKLGSAAVQDNRCTAEEIAP